MVYGNFVEGIVTEETPCEPLGIYGALKFAGEKMVIAYQPGVSGSRTRSCGRRPSTANAA